MKKFFNIKVGSTKVYGHAVKVDTEVSLEKRVKVLTESENSCFELVKLKKGTAYYEFDWNHDEDFKPKMIIGLSVSAEGDVCFYKMPKRTYISEISERKARQLAQGADSWKMLQGYVH